jgi:hypothetical protein
MKDLDDRGPGRPDLTLVRPVPLPEIPRACHQETYQAGGYPVQHIKEVICRQRGEDSFSVLADDEEGCALTVCLNCRTEAPIADNNSKTLTSGRVPVPAEARRSASLSALP